MPIKDENFEEIAEAILPILSNSVQPTKDEVKKVLEEDELQKFLIKIAKKIIEQRNKGMDKLFENFEEEEEYREGMNCIKK